jgi:hypothetical protein
MNARLASRSLRQRINLARFAAAPERCIAKARRLDDIFPARPSVTPLQAGREFVFYIRHERGGRVMRGAA